MAKSTGYEEIAAHFRQQIQAGEFAPGATLPSMREVCDRWDVAMTTANRAFRQLRLEGLTIGRPGIGTVVAGPASSSIANRVSLDALTGRALDPGEESRVLELGTVGADEIVASRLDVPPGTPVHVRRRVVSRGGTPVHYSSSFYPAFVIAVTPELTAPVSTGRSRELAAERLGVPQEHVLEEVTARLATSAEKAALGLSAESVIVSQVVRTVYLADGRVVEVAVKVAGGETILRWATSLAPTSEPSEA
ncbi:GntR family transcriptional regulator [Streptomyces sp. DSM 41982]|uniref:GntR family transcriptional regulator n=1 Tax=Streptomyces evansiae TaxID=3075535 RepID=A0ABD5ECQ4_9ACTN|nr:MULTISPECIES: GntR family transcriptional regulator [unclassified Streptomyces]MDT0418856.1 GntR family transcriptional regulator [Streptomyces sp. DSM 41982]SCD62403.1 transcriptional regulator, GntR family [Streptomyces sp. SolWspMP-sol7th]